MIITDSRPYELIRFQLDSLKPMQAINTAEFSSRPEGDQTLEQIRQKQFYRRGAVCSRTARS